MLRRVESVALALLVGVVLMAPSIAWVSLDRTIWPWDEAYYGSGAIDLWATLRLTPGSWWNAMTHVYGFWPPAIGWIGQFFVPFGNRLGSERVALMLGNEAALVLALALLYLAGLRLTDGRRLVALAGPLAAASAPLLVNLSHWYRVEPVQILSVVWVLFIMVSARRWHLSLTLAQLVAALSFGLLAKFSTPAYVAAPAIVAFLLSVLAARDRPIERWWRDWRFVASAVAALILAYVTAAWYQVNFSDTLDHARLAANSTFWGTPGSFGTHLHFWLIALRDALLLPYFDVALLAVLVASGVFVLVQRSRVPQASRYHLFVFLGCLGSCVGALLLLANQVNTDVRFIVPTVPAFALAIVLGLQVLDSKVVTAVTVGLFATQFALMTFQSFDKSAPNGLVRTAYHSYLPYHATPESTSPFAAQLDRIVRTACAGPSHYNTVGTNYAWLNSNTLAALADEDFALYGWQCEWGGVAFTPDDPDGFKLVAARNSPYFASVDYGNAANKLPSEFDAEAGLGAALNNELNRNNAALLRRVMDSGLYTVVPGSRRYGLVLLRHVGAA